jgi:phosphoribosylformylglycinamidine (FGAM) synthase-like enzyme
VVIAKGTGKALAMTVDCNSKYVYANPEVGAMIAVAEAARNIVCSGGEPIGVTNCLNFGNPYDPEVYYQFVKSVEGMGAACRKFNTPVTGGNVSFYNQNPDGPVFPTPTIGMVGIIEDMKNRMTLDFKNNGDTIILLGTQRNDIGSSEYLNKLKGFAHSQAPHFNLEEEFTLQQLVTSLIKDHSIISAHDISEGGLIVTLLESAFFNNKGFEIERSIDGINFETIGFVKGNTNSNRVNKYVFIDDNHASAFYRLKQIDFDGKYDFSNVISVQGNDLLIDITPNPFNNVIEINSNGQLVNVEVLDITGKVVISEVINGSKTTLNTASLNNGVYFVRINNGESVVTKRLIKN